MTAVLAALLLVPVLGAAATSLLERRVRASVGVAASWLTAVLAIALTVQTWRRGAAELRWSGPLDLEVVLLVDGLGVAMTAALAVTGAAVAVFALVEDRRAPEERHPSHWPLWSVLWAALQVLFLSGDLLTIFVLLEIAGIAAALLVALGRGRDALLAGTRRLFAEFIATVVVVLGIAALWSQTGTLVLSELASGAHVAGPGGWLGVGLITAGLLVKLPVVPLHLWLPGAHGFAPSAVSPLLSAIAVKAAFVVLMRVWYLASPVELPAATATVLGLLGGVGVVWASVVALRSREIKLLLAYSTIAQVSLLLLVPSLLAAGAREAWTGGWFTALAHAPAKAAMLLAAAVLVRDQGHPRVGGLAGAAARRPVAVFALGIAGVSLIGLPPTGGFVGKWYLLIAAIDAGQWGVVAVIVLGSLLTAGYVMRLVKPAFVRVTDDGPPQRRYDGRDLAALGLALVTLALGLRPAELLLLLERTLLGAPFGGGA